MSPSAWASLTESDRHAREEELRLVPACRHGLGKLVTVQHRNIEEHGFPEELHGKADALFLDLPGPWKARSSAFLRVSIPTLLRRNMMRYCNM